MIENILIIDTETTGLEPSKGAKLIEVGAVLYNIKHKAILQQFSSLYPCDQNPVEDINGISPAITQIINGNSSWCTLMLEGMASSCDAIVAHNAKFDKKFIMSCLPLPPLFMKPWICTKDHFKWSKQLFRNRLQDICEAYKIPYENAHRALADCLLLASCFTEVGDLQQRMEFACSAANSGFGNTSHTFR